MPPRKVIVPIVFTAVVAVGAIAWRFLREPIVVASGTATHAAPAPAPSPAPSSSPSPSPSPSLERVEAATPQRASIDAPRSAQSQVAIDCHVVVLDESETEYSEEDGTLTPCVLLHSDDRTIPEDELAAWVWTPLPKATVTAGSFSIEVPDGSAVGIQEAELGGRPASFVGAASNQVTAGGENRFRLRWSKGIRLHVVDAKTHAELDGVTVLARCRKGFIGLPPGNLRTRTLVEHGTSPVTILPVRTVDPSLDAHGQYYAWAPGHAWARVEIPDSIRSDPKVELPAGASLDIVVEGELPVRPARADPRPGDDDEELAQLRVCKASGDDIFGAGHDFGRAFRDAVVRFSAMDPASFPGGQKPTLEEFKKGLARYDNRIDRPALRRFLTCEQPAALGLTPLDGLTPGKVDILVELGEPQGRPLQTARATVELVAGETAHVTLNSKIEPFPALVPVAGTLHVPAAWSTQDAQLEIASTDLAGVSSRDRVRLPLRKLATVPGDPETLRFDAGLLPTATWRFSIESLAFERDLRIAAPDSDRVKLEVPEAGTLFLTVLDSTSGQPVNVGDVGWRVAGAWILVAPGFRFHDIEGSHRLAALLPVGAGNFDLGLGSEWRLDLPASAIIHPGEQEFTLRVHHAHGVRLKLECGGTHVFWSTEATFGVSFESIGGDGAVTSFHDGLFVVSRPGRYRVTIPTMEEFAAVEPFEVDVPTGEYLEYEVELRRR